MKVHKYQIEVMWLFMATLFCRTTNENKVVDTFNNELKECIYTDKYNIRNSRPPP